MKYFFIFYILATTTLIIKKTDGYSDWENISLNYGSPFNRNKDNIVNNFLSLIRHGNSAKAFKLVSSTVEAEKAWNQQRCEKMFGIADCSGRSLGHEPMAIWKKIMIIRMKMDPTETVLRYIRKHLKALD